MSRQFIAFYPGDYMRDTMHLSTLEHGVYFLLLQHCWVHGSIPLAPFSRAKLAKISLRKWYKICANIDPFFDEQGRNKRATKEIEKAEKTSTRQTMAGHRGAAKRWGTNGHGYTMANSHGHGTSDGHGIALQNKNIINTTSVAARARGTEPPSHPPAEPAEPVAGTQTEAAAKPPIAISTELLGTIQNRGWTESRPARQRAAGPSGVSGSLAEAIKRKGWV